MITIEIDPRWPAPRVAAAILAALRNAYGDSIIDGLQATMERVWLDVQKLLTDDERALMTSVTQVTVPTGSLNAYIARPPSRIDYYLLFDAMLDQRLYEIFTAPRHKVVWIAAFIRAAWVDRLTPMPYWMATAEERQEALAKRTGGQPDSYSFAFARAFILAHECGHFFLNHLASSRDGVFRFGGLDWIVFDPDQKDELAADAFARDLLCRDSRHSLLQQQIGSDSLFGMVGAIYSMRQSAEAVRKGADEYSPARKFFERRDANWHDYNQRRHASLDASSREPESVLTMERMRANVDLINNHYAGALAFVYAKAPERLLEFERRICGSPMTEDALNSEYERFHAMVNELLVMDERQPRLQGWWRRLFPGKS